mmetsp:Transcript_24498/g.44316  ORF Transcript_24498/g.44316 Transcript_24498/m.44316 type:complete len:202 (-) Transcript_24498:20-625(-)
MQSTTRIIVDLLNYSKFFPDHGTNLFIGDRIIPEAIFFVCTVGSSNNLDKLVPAARLFTIFIHILATHMICQPGTRSDVGFVTIVTIQKFIFIAVLVAEPCIIPLHQEAIVFILLAPWSIPVGITVSSTEHVSLIVVAPVIKAGFNDLPNAVLKLPALDGCTLFESTKGFSGGAHSADGCESKRNMNLHSLNCHEDGQNGV